MLKSVDFIGSLFIICGSAWEAKNDKDKEGVVTKARYAQCNGDRIVGSPIASAIQVVKLQDTYMITVNSNPFCMFAIYRLASFITCKIK